MATTSNANGKRPMPMPSRSPSMSCTDSDSDSDGLPVTKAGLRALKKKYKARLKKKYMARGRRQALIQAGALSSRQLAVPLHIYNVVEFDPTVIFHTEFDDFAEIDDDDADAVADFVYYDMSWPVADRKTHRDSFPFMDVGDQFLTLEGRVVTVTEDHPHLIRDIDNSVARIPRVLEPFARLLYAMLMESNTKIQAWDDRKDAVPDSEDWEWSLARHVDRDNRMAVCAMAFQEGKSVSGISLLYTRIVLDGLVSVMFTQMNGGVMRRDEFARSIDDYCSWESTGARNHITVRQCFDYLIHTMRDHGVQPDYADGMIRFFHAGRAFEPSDPVSLRNGHYELTVPVLVPSVAGVRKLTPIADYVDTYYGTKDGRSRINVVPDEWHELMNGAAPTRRDALIDFVTTRATCVDGYSSTPHNIIASLGGVKVWTRRRHSPTYYGFGQDVHPDRRVKVHQQYDHIVRQWNMPLPSGQLYPTSMITDTVVRNVLRWGVNDMIQTPDKHLVGWRHGKINISSAKAAQNVCWEFASVEELGMICVEWMTENTKSDAPIFDASTKSGSRVYVPETMMRDIAPWFFVDFDPNESYSAWTRVHTAFGPEVELTLRSSLVNASSPPADRCKVFVINFFSVTALCELLDVMEFVWKHANRTFPLRFLCATGASNSSGVVNKSSGHSTMLTDVFFAAKGKGGNPVETTANASNICQMIGRGAGQFPLITPTAPPDLWCNSCAANIIAGLPILVREMALISRDIDFDDLAMPNGLLEAIIHSNLVIDKDEFPQLWYYCMAARTYMAERIRRGKDVSRLGCNIFTGNAADGREHFRLLTSMRVSADPNDTGDFPVPEEYIDFQELSSDSEGSGFYSNFSDSFGTSDRWFYDNDQPGDDPDQLVSDVGEVAHKRTSARVVIRQSKLTAVNVFHGKPAAPGEISAVRHILEKLLEMARSSNPNAGPFTPQQREAEFKQLVLTNGVPENEVDLTPEFKKAIYRPPKAVQLCTMTVNNTPTATRVFRLRDDIIAAMQKTDFTTAALTPAQRRQQPAVATTASHPRNERSMLTLYGKQGRKMHNTIGARTVRAVLVKIVEDVLGPDLANHLGESVATFVGDNEAAIRSLRYHRGDLVPNCAANDNHLRHVREKPAGSSSGTGWTTTLAVEARNPQIVYSIHNDIISSMRSCQEVTLADITA